MAYPEKGATYQHRPKFIERMHLAEGGRAGERSKGTQSEMKDFIERSRDRLDSDAGPSTEPLDTANEWSPDEGGIIDPKEGFLRLNRRT